jgi:hypothetical protein
MAAARARDRTGGRGGDEQRRRRDPRFRFDTSELGETWTEICAYGTAVKAHKL